MTTWELSLLATPEAVPEVRGLLRHHDYDVRLCVSEMLTNVVDHVGEGTPVTVRVVGPPAGHTRIEVTDPDPRALPYSSGRPMPPRSPGAASSSSTRWHCAGAWNRRREARPRGASWLRAARGPVRAPDRRLLGTRDTKNSPEPDQAAATVAQERSFSGLRIAHRWRTRWSETPKEYTVRTAPS